MKKVLFTCIILILSIYIVYAQKLIITEVDAPATSFFNAASVKSLGKGMDLNISGKTLTLKIGDEPELNLTQLADQCFGSEIKTTNGILKLTIKLKTTNSVITAAQFTGTIIPSDKSQKQTWWTVTAHNTDVVLLSSLGSI